MAKKKEVNLTKLSMKHVTMFRLANRKGFATIAQCNLTEGATIYQAYCRLIKACRRNGYELPEKKANELPKM